LSTDSIRYAGSVIVSFLKKNNPKVLLSVEQFGSLSGDAPGRTEPPRPVTYG
jgi:hypothetical protein